MSMKAINRFVKYLRMSPTKALAIFGISGGAVALVLRFAHGRAAKIALVACIIGILLLVLLVRAIFHWRAEKKARGMYQTLDDQHQSALAVAPEEKRARLEEMRERFTEAVEELRKAKKNIYDLPWFLLLGEPQSGKSMTLRGSDLNFPVGTDRLSGLGGTRNCDWWFANQAVILDTAGRFTFQEEGAPDRSEWESFLGLLAKKRRRCPINGVIVVVPVDALLNDTPEVRKEKAKNIHSKLGEIQRNLGVQFPVFLVITKCDLIVGFSEFFREFGEVQAAQIMGWSNAERFDEPYAATRLAEDIGQVYQRLCQRRLEVLRQPISFAERGLVYAFPEEFRALTEPLRHYLDIMFAPDIYHDSLFFRGYYFTSGMQEGEPIVSVGRDILAGGRPGSTVKEEFDPLGNLFPSRPFFIADMYKSKILPEKGMIFRSAADIVRSKKMKRWTLIGGLALSMLLAFLLILGGVHINDVIANPRKHAEQALAQVYPGQAATDIAELPPVDALVDLIDEDSRNLQEEGWWFRITFPFSLSKPVDYMQQIHDGLYARERLERSIRELTAYLTAPPTEQDLDPDRSERLDSLWEYVAMYVGRTPRSAEEGGAGASFDRLFAPIYDPIEQDEAYRELRQHFAHMHPETRSELFRSILPPDAGEDGGAIEQAIEQAVVYFVGAYLSERGPDLGPWIALVNSCEQFEARQGDLLGLIQPFLNAETLNEYKKVRDEWEKWYVGGALLPGKRQGFHEAKKRAKVMLERLRPKAQQLKGEAAGAGIVVPDLDQVQRAWTAFFGPVASTLADIVSPTGEDTRAAESLYSVVEGSQAEGQVKDRMHGWIERAVAKLKQKAQQTIAEVRRKKEDQLGHFYLAEAKLTVELEMAAGLLANLDLALPSTRPPEISENLDDWLKRLPPARKNPRIQSAETATVSSFFMDEDWVSKEDGFRALIAAVATAVGRHTCYVELAQAHDILSRRSLDSLRSGDRQQASQSVTGFKGVLEAHRKSFMQDTLDHVEGIQAALENCRPRKACLMSEDSTFGNDPARTVSNLLDHKLRDYAQDYFRAWCGSYSKEYLDDYERLSTCDSWSQCVERLVKTNVHLQAERQIDSFISSVLEVDDLPGEPLHPDLRSKHNDIIAEARAATECGEHFKDLDEALTLSDYDEKQKSLARQARDSFLAFKRRAGRIGGDATGSLADKGWDTNSKTWSGIVQDFSSIRTIQQLNDLRLWASYRLDELLDQRLRKLIKKSFRVELEDLNHFPFQRAQEVERPKQVAMEDFAGFLRGLSGKGKYPSLSSSEDGERKYQRNEGTVGREEFIRRCALWREFLYGGKEHGLENLRNNTPENVTFTVQSWLPKEDSKRTHAGSVYGEGFLMLGGMRDDSGNAYETLNMHVFDLREKSDPTAGESRVWAFGKTPNTWLELKGPATASYRGPKRLKMGNCTIKDSPWSLPMFIYRFCRKPARLTRTINTIDAVGTVWDVIIPIELKDWIEAERQKSVVAIFEITIKNCGKGDCALPPLIGSFSPPAPPKLSSNLDE